MYRKNIALQKQQDASPLIRIHAFELHAATGFVSSSRAEASLAECFAVPSIHPLTTPSAPYLLHYIPSMGRKLPLYPLDYGKGRRDRPFMRNGDMNDDVFGIKSESRPGGFRQAA